MTPFDVIKTRLQTQSQPEAFFVPSSHVPPPSVKVSATSPSSATAPSSRYDSNAKAKGKAPALSPVTPAMQHARSLAATNLATCCQKTYFTNNFANGKEILCRFDPRDIPSASASSSSIPSGSSNTASSAASRIIPVQFENPHVSMSAQGAAIALDSGEACVYPNPSIAKQHLPHLSAPSARHFAGFFDAVSKIAQHEGISTLWRGVSTSLVMSVPSQVIYMVGYDYLRTTAFENAPSRFVQEGTTDPTRLYVGLTTFAAGSVSRTAVATLLAPLELFRTRLQSTGSHVTTWSVTHSVRDLVRAQGVSSLWRGLSATLWRDVPFSGVYWAGYEAIRRLLSQGRGMGEINHDDKASKTFSIAFASGAGSGMVRSSVFMLHCTVLSSILQVASFLTHPFDVIKVRRQTEGHTAENRSTLAYFKQIAKSEGMAGLWRGFVPRVAKVAPACGIMIGAYEIGLRWTGESEEK